MRDAIMIGIALTFTGLLLLLRALLFHRRSKAVWRARIESG
jgi:hypothetical protein